MSVDSQFKTEFLSIMIGDSNITSLILHSVVHNDTNAIRRYIDTIKFSPNLVTSPSHCNTAAVDCVDSSFSFIQMIQSCALYSKSIRLLHVIMADFFAFESAQRGDCCQLRELF